VVTEPICKRQSERLQLGACKSRPRRRVDVCRPGSRVPADVAWRTRGEEPGENGRIEDGDIREVGRVDSRGHGGLGEGEEKERERRSW